MPAPLTLIWMAGMLSVLFWIELPGPRIALRSLVDELVRSGEITDDSAEAHLAILKLGLALLWPLILAQWVINRTKGDR